MVFLSACVAETSAGKSDVPLEEGGQPAGALMLPLALKEFRA